MAKVFLLAAVLAVAGCSAVPYRPDPKSPCQVSGEASYDCQVERYLNVDV